MSLQESLEPASRPERDDVLGVVDELTPEKIVQELDRYIIAQEDAKRAVAIALRNRWRRLQVAVELRDEITPKNILMIGPTGVGKTEISRRLAGLAKAPFAKVEATKYTEVGYVGRDVDSIIRDLVEASYSMVREEEQKLVQKAAEQIAEERILDALLPGSAHPADAVEIYDAAFDDDEDENGETIFLQDTNGVGSKENKDETAHKTRDKLQELLREGKLEDRIIEFETFKQVHTQMQIMGPQGFGEIEGQIKDMFANMVPKQREYKKLPVKDARKYFVSEAQESLLDPDALAQKARDRAEKTGIVFIDEVDKICGSLEGKGPDVSREGVQRDLLPLVEGCTVSTKYGSIKTDHILFIASGAFHASKPSDLMPEFQGRFPIRVELESLMPEHFVRILTEPKNALTQQYAALLGVEGVKLVFTESGIHEIAKLTAEVNTRTENIGARRLHTLLEKVLDEISFQAHTFKGQTVEVDALYVQKRLGDIVEDVDLSRFIL